MILFLDDYVAVIPDYLETSMHSHSMLHIILSAEPVTAETATGRLMGTLIFIDTHYHHSVSMTTGNSVVFLVDASSALATSIRKEYLKTNKAAAYDHSLKMDVRGSTAKEFTHLCEVILEQLKVKKLWPHHMDERIAKVLQGVKANRWLFKNVGDIAGEMALSEGRLSHLFKSETGMRLKNYLLIQRLKYAYQLIEGGWRLTDAALEAGFSDSAHLAATAKKTTGIPISAVI